MDTMDTFKADALSSAAVEMLGQLYTNGPTWDSNVCSKAGRGDLVRAGRRHGGGPTAAHYRSALNRDAAEVLTLHLSGGRNDRAPRCRPALPSVAPSE